MSYRPMDCPNCGNRNREGARFCDSCGFELAPPRGAPAETPDGAEGNGAPKGDRAARVPIPQSASPPPDAPRRIDDRYEVKRFLGRGGRKDVYLAHHGGLDRDVAVALFDTEGMGEAALAPAPPEMQAMEKLG